LEINNQEDIEINSINSKINDTLLLPDATCWENVNNTKRIEENLIKIIDEPDSNINAVIASTNNETQDKLKDWEGYEYSIDEFRRTEIIWKINGDGNCLFRSILASLSLDDNQQVALRRAIAKWMNENADEFITKFGWTEEETVQRSSEILSGDWGDESEIFAFEKMSGILVIVYEEIHNIPADPQSTQNESTLVKYTCRRGITNRSQEIGPKIVILYGKMYQNLSKANNHYSTIVRDVTQFEAITHKFTSTFLVEKISDELPRRPWPEKEEKEAGKRKKPPENYLDKIENDNYTAYEIGIINGIKVFSLLTRGTWIDCFWSIKGGNLNEDLKPEEKVNYINYLDKNKDCPNFTTSWCNNWTKNGGKNIGLPKLSAEIPKNVCFSSNITLTYLNERYEMWLELRKKIPHAICYTCSGKSKNGTPLIRYFPTLQEMIEHCRNHSSTVSAHSYFNLEINSDEWVLILATAKPKTYVLIRKEIMMNKISVIKRDLGFKPSLPNRKGGGEDGIWGDIDITTPPVFRIVGWNARSAFKPENVYFISKYLNEESPDFLLINESGNYKDSIVKQCKQYANLHSGNRLLVFSKKEISVTPIMKEGWDDTMMILKITMDKKSLILVNIYRPPGEEDVTSRICAKILNLDYRYENTPFVIFGDLNYRREDVEKQFNSVADKEFKILMKKGEEIFTREQDTYLGKQKSYLDYFIVKNLTKCSLTIDKPIGNSDHLSLKLDVYDQTLRIKRRLNLTRTFTKVEKHADEIGARLVKALKSEDPVESISILINTLRFENKMKLIKPRSHFKVIEKLVNCNEWLEIRKLIQHTNRENFLEFMASFERLKTNRRDREYFLRLRFYSELNKDVGVLNDMIINDIETGEKIVTTDKVVINQIITDKYNEIFDGANGKRVLPLLSENIMVYTDSMILTALTNLNLSKATSWDFIPGKAFDMFLKNTALIPLLTNFINKMLSTKIIPDVIALARLFCLNKNASQPGTEDDIRPIVIAGIVTKLIEYPLNKELKQVPLNKAQLGFREKLSTELNILRLRDRTHKALYHNYDRKKKLRKIYILFIDKKQAFDRVNQKILIDKLKKKGVEEKIINTLIILLNSGLISVDLLNKINVNSGVGQGKICSPLEFDIYIDDLLDMTDAVCHTSLAFADDTGFVCNDIKELIQTIRTIDKWSIDNKIKINRKKSGIIIINGDSTDPDSIEGHTVVGEYKYLGILVDTKLSPRTHICSLNRKLKVYLQRDKMLHKKFFTPYSLMTICDYFIKSRLSYGLSCFLDNESAMRSIEKSLLKHLKSIFDLPVNTSHRRLQVLLGEPDLRIRLSIRLLKNWHKYKKHFGEEPEIVKKSLKKFFSEDILNSQTAEYDELKSTLINKNLKEKGDEEYLGVSLRDNHKEFLKKFVFSYPDKRDYLLIKFFTRTCRITNSRLFPKCTACGEDNTVEHASNSCKEKMTEEEREIHTEEFRTLFQKAKIETGRKVQLYDYLLWTMFKIEAREGINKEIKQLVEKMKTVITKLIMTKEERSDYTDD
jgi:hypothetical protein